MRVTVKWKKVCKIKEEKGIFRGSKDGAGHELKVKQIIEVNKDIKLTNTQRQHLTCIANIILIQE